MLRSLRLPYPFDPSPGRNLRNSAIMGGFVWMFLWIFKPFGLNAYAGPLLLVTAGYGLITLLAMAVMNIGMVVLLPRFFAEERWTGWRELGWTLANIALIGLANGLYSAALDMDDLTPATLLMFESYALLIGIFPILAAILVRQSQLSQAYMRSSEALNTALDEREMRQEMKQIDEYQAIEREMIIPAENGRDSLSLSPEALLFIRAADNYAEVFFLENGKLRCYLIRNSLKNIGEALTDHDALFRCHKSYLVNLAHVRHVSGNAQGYKLHLNHTEELLPVSRMHNDSIRQRLG